jgi:hypothetical protein
MLTKVNIGYEKKKNIASFIYETRVMVEIIIIIIIIIFILSN